MAVAAKTHRFDAIVCLGCQHGERRRTSISLPQRWPQGPTAATAATGVLIASAPATTNSVEEALERAADGPSNKGWEAAAAAIEMAAVAAHITRADTP
jgi:6,7-dimethyl-8-ribityllumazine synthase